MYTPRDTTGLPSTLLEGLAGDSLNAQATITTPASQAITSPSSAWDLVDSLGVVYATGTANLVITETSWVKTVALSASVTLPSALPPSSRDRAYSLRWTLVSAGAPLAYHSSPVKVVGLVADPVGNEHSVEMEGDTIYLGVVLDQVYDTVTLDVFKENTRLTPTPLTVSTHVRVSSGEYYSYELQPETLGIQFYLTASLDPYSISWRYWKTNATRYRTSGQFYVTNPSVLSACSDVQQLIARAGSNLFSFSDRTFTQQDIITMLRRGKDLFNAAGGLPTLFTMLHATGGIREYWLRYTEVALLRAQALAEGEQAFNFSGQAISLDVDRAQHYQTLADSLQSQLDQDVKPLKAGLLKKGLSSGDGDMSQMNNHSSARVGISIHPASQFGRYPWGQNRY
jgi:hypothetical protein